MKFLFCAVVVSVFLLLQNSSPSTKPQSIVNGPQGEKSKSAEQYPAPEQCGSEENPFVVEVVTSQAQNKSTSNADKSTNNQSKGWGLSDKIAASAIIIGFLQFLALVSTVGVMVRNGHRELRAYVLPERGSLYDGTTAVPANPNRTNVPGVTMMFKNSGQTPAYRVWGLMNIAVIRVVEENTSLVLPKADVERFPLTLGSDSIFFKSHWFDRPLTPNEIADIGTGVRAIYCFGHIEYQDAFKKRRCANFRLHYTGEYPPPVDSQFSFSDRGNDAN